jgi:serine palmitoyltransferase
MVRLPYVTALTTLFSYGLLFAFGQLRDFFRRILDARKPSNLKVMRCPRPCPRPCPCCLP